MTFVSAEHGLAAGDLGVFNITRNTACSGDAVGDLGLVSVRVEWQGTGEVG